MSSSESSIVDEHRPSVGSAVSSISLSFDKLTLFADKSASLEPSTSSSELLFVRDFGAVSLFGLLREDDVELEDEFELELDVGQRILVLLLEVLVVSMLDVGGGGDEGRFVAVW